MAQYGEKENIINSTQLNENGNFECRNETGTRGFTLIELLVVVAIIGLLASIIVASVNTARQKAKYAAAKQLDANFNHNLGDALVGQWLFDECSGTSAINTGGGINSGTLIGGVIWSTDTPFGSGCSVSFNGSTGYIDSGVDSSTQISGKSVSISAWIKTASAQ
jgi:prepilin-type N-terminal cleavage/methylation domain-containing protein